MNFAYHHNWRIFSLHRIIARPEVVIIGFLADIVKMVTDHFIEDFQVEGLVEWAT